MSGKPGTLGTSGNSHNDYKMMTLRDGGIEMLRQLCESGTCQVREDGLKASLIYEDAWPQSKPRRLKQTYQLMPGDEANFDLEHRGIYLRNDVRDSMHTYICI